MNFDPRVVAPQPGAVILPDMVVVEQEMLDAGVTYDQAEAQMDQAARELGDAQMEVNANNMVQQLNQTMGLSLTDPTAEEIGAAQTAINQAKGGNTMDEQTQDAMLNSEMDRETHLALAAYAMAKMLDKLPTNMIDPSLQTDYHAHINALDPATLVF